MRFKIFIYSLILYFIFSAQIEGQNTIPGINDPSFGIPIQWCQAGSSISCKINRRVRQLKLLNELYNWPKNVSACLEQGYSPETCSDAASFCFTTNTIPLGSLGPFGAWANTFNLQQLLKTNCGTGKCFQCCYAEGGCHSSFEGFPVINCNYNYGADAAAAGTTHVLDGEPGDACLFTPQTCEHIPQCNYNLSIEEVEEINNDPEHLMKTEAALSNRRLWLANKLGELWEKVFNRYGNLGDSGVLPEMESSDSLFLFNYNNIVDFTTGRGGKNWKDITNTTYNWDTSQFIVYNQDSSAIDTLLSQYRATRQIAILRVLGSIPNFINRFNYVESRIWTDSAKEEYLMNIDNPDEELLKYMYPMTLQFLKILSNSPYNVIQDYRLFSVPLPDEENNGSVNNFNATTIGSPPSVNIDVLGIGNDNVINTKINIDELDIDFSSESVPVYILWGDGYKDEITVSNNTTINVDHTYSNSGQFQLLVVAENKSGLRAVAGEIITITNDASAIDSIEMKDLDIREIRIKNLGVSNGVFTGFPSDVIFKVIGVNFEGESQEIGRSTRIRLDTKPAIYAEVPFIRCEIPIGFQLDKIIVEAAIYNSGAFRIMWNVISENSSFWTLEGVELVVGFDEDSSSDNYVISTEDMEINLIELGNYYTSLSNNTLISNYVDREYLDNNQIRLPFIDEEIKYKGFEFDLPNKYSLNDLNISSIVKTDNEIIGSWKEDRPYHYISSDEATSVLTHETTESMNLFFYPNPAGNNGILKFHVEKHNVINIQLFNALGKKVKIYKNLRMDRGNHELIINRDNLSNGIYLLSVSTKDGKLESIPIIFF